MKLRLLFLLLFPLFAYSQPKRSLAVRKLYDQAVTQYNAGNQAESLRLFEECVAADSTYTEAYLNISYITFDQNNFVKALVNAKKALKYNQFQAPIFIQTGKCFYYLEEYDSAAYFLNKGISFGAKAESDYLYLAKCMAYQGEYRDATFYFGKALEINPNNGVAYNERGSAYFQLGEYELAKADFEKALALNPQSTGALANMANVSLALGDNETALTYINKGIETATGDQKIQLLILKGNYYKTIGEFENASLAYEEAFQLDNQNAVILNNQASIMIELENYQGAFEKCNEALDLQPEMMEAYFNRGIANEMLRNVEAACMDWEQAFILGSSIAEEYLNSPVCNE